MVGDFVPVQKGNSLQDGQVCYTGAALPFSRSLRLSS